MKKLLLLLSALFLCGTIAYTCWYDGGDGAYKFVKQEIINDPTLLLFVEYEAGLWFGYSNNAKEPEDANLQAWKTYLKEENISDVDLAALIYKMPKNQLVAILADKKQLAEVAKENAVLRIWQKNKKMKKAMGGYLLLAKDCETEADKEIYYWDEKSKRNLDKIQKLLEQSLLNAKSEKDAFIKRRYALQALRMAFYSNDYTNVRLTFDQYFAKGEKDYTYYRALELKAGVMTVQGEPEAAHSYAAVFANCPDRRNVCLNSFQFTNSNDWDRAIRLCQNDEEKAVFHTMRALQNGANIVEEMEAIAALAPASPYLELLFARQINYIQSYAFPTYLSEYENYPNKEIDGYYEMGRLKQICNQLRQNKALENHDFWQLAAAYTELLNYNYNESLKLLSEVPKASKYYIPAKVLRFVTQLCALDRIDSSIADALWGEFKGDTDLSENTDLVRFTEDVFSMRYAKQNDLARAFLVHNSMDGLQQRLNLELINAIEAFMTDNQNIGIFDKFLKEQRVGGLSGMNRLYEMRGVYYLQHNELDKAMEEFEKCSASHQRDDEFFNSPYLDRSIWSESVFHPYFSDDIEGQPVTRLYEQYDFLNKNFNLLTYTQQLKDLEALAKKEPTKADQYYYLLGIAWLNTSPYGWNRPAYYYVNSNEGYSIWWINGKKPEMAKVMKDYTWYNYFYYDASIASHYFDKAIQASQNPELKAKALYMKAKVEKTLTPLTDWWMEPIDIDNEAYWACFKQLKQEFSNTDYYKEIIRECYDFRAFLKQ